MSSKQQTESKRSLSLLDKHHVDLVITDLVMPKLTGFDLVGQIRSKRPQIPILIISAHISQHAEKISDGNAEFMYKPIDPPDLIATVRRLLPTPR